MVSMVESVAFDSPADVSDGAGGRTRAWVVGHLARASFRYLRAGEAVLQARLSGQVTIVATIRDCAAARAITTEWRMRDLNRGPQSGAMPGEVYNVRSIIPTDDRLFLEITCQSGVAI